MKQIAHVKHNDAGLINFMATEIINQFEVYQPSQKQISAIESFISLMISQGRFTDEKLSERERSCLYLAAQGKSSRETAGILHISMSTVETYRNNIKQKLNSRNITHAVLQGMMCGEVFPNNICEF